MTGGVKDEMSSGASSLHASEVLVERELLTTQDPTGDKVTKFGAPASAKFRPSMNKYSTVFARLRDALVSVITATTRPNKSQA